MTTKQREQTWILGAFAGIGGWDNLHPGVQAVLERGVTSMEISNVPLARSEPPRCRDSEQRRSR